MSNGWDQSAQAWIAAMGEDGDWSRTHVLDPVMCRRLEGRRFETALDVGCGEGRFCRMLRARGIDAVGIDPTWELIEEAQRRDPGGAYRIAPAEQLPFAEASFDLVVSYLTLIDIADFRAAIGEMARVLKSGGTLLIANINSFISSSPTGWTKDRGGPQGALSGRPVPRGDCGLGAMVRHSHSKLASPTQRLHVGPAGQRP